MEEEGRLEVLLVNAQGIKRRFLMGKPGYYVVIECGDEIRRSKTSRGHRHEAFWNEKFEFDLPLSKWKELGDLKMSIMDEEYFKHQGFVGHSMIEVGGIISEAQVKGRSIQVLPSWYNVILKDHSYKGQIKVAFKFSLNPCCISTTIIGHANAGEVVEDASNHSIYMNWLRFLNVPSSWWNWRFNLLSGRN